MPFPLKSMPFIDRRPLWSVAVASLLLAACGDDSAGPSGPGAIPVATVVITTPRDELLVGESHDFDAVARSATGEVLTNRTVTWRSEDPSIATINASGVLQALRSGTVQIVASSEGREIRLAVRVIAPNALPVLNATAPDRLVAGRTTPLTVQLQGTGFTAQSVALWDGIARPTEYVSATELRMTLTPDDLGTAGASAISVRTPAPGGGTSAATVFTVEMPVPAIDAVNPQRIVRGWAMPLTVTLTGAGFTGATQLFVDDQVRAIDQRTATTISFRLVPGELTTVRTIGIRVVNGAPGGGIAATSFEVQQVPVASVSIEAPRGLLWTWARLRLPVRGTVRSATNATLPDRVLQWSSDNAAVASVIGDGVQEGVVWGNSAGITKIRATVDGVTGEAPVKVYETPAYDVMYAGGTPGDRYVSIWPVGTGNAPYRIPLGRQAVYPAPSPDGRSFAFVSVSDMVSYGELHTANVDGTNIRRLTNDDAGDYQPSWSPDGSRIAWVSSRTGLLNIFTMRPDGSDVQQLTFTRMADPLPGSGQSVARPAWSPDGQRIAYTVGVDGGAQLWVMNADGSNKRRLAPENGVSDFEPTWSGDGRTIAVRRVRPAPIGGYLARIDVATGAEMLSPFGTTVTEAATPSWSPDGRWLITGSSVVGDSPTLYAVPMTEFDRGSRLVLPALWEGGVREARWIRRTPAAARR